MTTSEQLFHAHMYACTIGLPTEMTFDGYGNPVLKINNGLASIHYFKNKWQLQNKIGMPFQKTLQMPVDMLNYIQHIYHL